MKNTLNNLLAAAMIASTCSFIAPSGNLTNPPAETRPSVEPTEAQINAAIAPAEGTSIKGRVEPVDAAVEAVALSATDSVTVAVTDGMFLLNVRRGTYKLIVVGKAPYKNVIKDNIEVADGNTTDIGTIRMQE